MRTEEAEREAADAAGAARGGRAAPNTSADGDQIMRGDSNGNVGPDAQSQGMPMDTNIPPTVLAGVANVHVSGNSSVVSSQQSFGVAQTQAQTGTPQYARGK